MIRLTTTALMACTALLVACGQAETESSAAATPLISETGSVADAPVTASMPEAAAPVAAKATPAVPIPPTPAAPPLPAVPSLALPQDTAVTPSPVLNDMAGAQTASLGTHPAFAGYDQLLRDHVGPLGFIDYDALAADPAALAAYVESLADPAVLPPVEAADMQDARLATLINAYNAFTLQLILDEYDAGQLKSITDLHGGKPWDQKLWNLAGNTISLNQLEHEMIRVEFPQEPRIHWAVVCAAYSCPPLRAEAYTAAQLEEQLADQERRVLLSDDPRFIEQDGQTLRVTKLFEWYGSDFGVWRDYLAQRLPSAKNAADIQFVTYNWALNSRANRPTN